MRQLESFLHYAISLYVQTAIQICVFTAVSLVPRNALMCRCCLIHLKSSSTCQRCRSMVVASNAYTVASRSTANDSSAYNGRAMPIRCCAKSA